VGKAGEGAPTAPSTLPITKTSTRRAFGTNALAGGGTRGANDFTAVRGGSAEDNKPPPAGRRESRPAALDLGTLILIAIIGFLLIRFITRSMFTPTRRRASRWGSSSGPIFFPTSGSWDSGSSSWGSGSSDSGFSGGGGSFGGGGASGSW